jgi:hypothetical protein
MYGRDHNLRTPVTVYLYTTKDIYSLGASGRNKENRNTDNVM